MNRKMIEWFGLTGILALLSYTAAVVFSRQSVSTQFLGCTCSKASGD